MNSARAEALRLAVQSSGQMGFAPGGDVAAKMIVDRAEHFLLFLEAGAAGSVDENPRPRRGRRSQADRVQE